jgi:hypothetical protein
MANTSGLAFALTSGNTYEFDFKVLFQSLTTNACGIRLGLTFPAATIVTAATSIPAAADGTSGMYHGWITTSGDSVVGTGVQAISTTYIAWIYGVIRPSANGTLQVQHGSEVSAQAIRVKEQSIGKLTTIS